MIELNQTSGNNNQVIWVLKLYGEGSEAITLGDFSASTGWTTGGDWAISGGVANYTYVDDSSGTLSRSVTVGTGSYIFSYEVLEKSGTGFSLKIDSSSGIVASDIDLDLGYGKHSYSIQCNGGSTFKLTASGFGADDYLVIDNVSLKAADNTTYISTRDIELNNTYDGKVLNKTSPFSNVVWSSTIQGSGGAGAVTSYSLSISRHIGNSNLDGFFNEFYPATGGGQLTSKIIDLGIVWEGASGDNEITWLLRGRIIEYSYSQRTLNLTVFQESEIISREIPYYSIQKSYNNAVSYYEYAPEDNYGVSIPIVYGSFNVDLMDYDLKKLAPCPCIDKRYLMFSQASHKLYTQNSPTYTDALYKYISGADTYMVLIPDKGASVNTDIESKVRLFASTKIATEGVKGKLFLVPKTVGLTSDYNEIQNILDNSDSTYLTIADTKRLSVKVHPDIANSEIGVLDSDASDVKLQVDWQSDNGGNRQLKLNIYLHDESTPAYGTGTSHTTTNTGGTWDTDVYEIGTYIASRRSANTYPWRIDDLVGLEFIMENTSGVGASSGDLRIRQFVLIISDIEVIAPFNESVPMHIVAAANEGLI